MRTAAAERSQGGRGRLILADQQSFERFPLHTVTPARILLHSKLSSTTRCEHLKDQRYPLAPFDGVAAVHPALGQLGPVFQYTAKGLCRPANTRAVPLRALTRPGPCTSFREERRRRAHKVSVSLRSTGPGT
jgi:hypothetical protein